MTRECIGCLQVLPVTEFGTKGRLANGEVRRSSRCRECAKAANTAQRARARNRNPDPLGADPLLPIEPFRAWLDRVITRKARCMSGIGSERLSGALETLARELSVSLGGTPDRWGRTLYRYRYEARTVRLSAADALLTLLDFDGTRVDDLWPLEEEEQAA